MHIDVRSFVDVQRAVRIDQGVTIDDVRQFVGPMGGLQTVGHDLECRESADGLVGHNVTRILSPGDQLDHLRVAIGKEHDAVLNDKGRTGIGGIDGDVQEGIDAVIGRNGLVVKLRSRLAIEVDLEPG